MNFQLQNKVGARFKLVVRKASDDRITTETDWFWNLVLDTGLARMSVGTWIDRCCVGTGNSTPVVTQVALDNFLASTSSQQASSQVINTTNAPYYYGMRTTWRFGEGVAAGNISEVGLGWGNANLWNRTLIKDANGNPTTITVLSDEYLDVVSEVRVYPADNLSGTFNLLDKTGAVVSTHATTAKPYISSSTVAANFGKILLGNLATLSDIYFTRMYSNSSSGLGASITETPSGNATTVAGSTTGYPTTTSVAGRVQLDLNSAYSDIGAFLLGNTIMSSSNSDILCGYQIAFTPRIQKLSTQIMVFNFQLSWGRYTG